MRLVLAGTPDVAVPSLRALLGSRHDVVGVVTRPDAAAGRGRRSRPSPVRVVAQEHGLPVLAPEHPREPAFVEALAALAPDCVPVVAYGALVPRAAREVPRHGWVNLHFSLLPAWRGAAPVQHAVMAGDDVTGATVFRLEAGMDTGPVLGTMTERVRGRDTAGDLLGRLAEAGAGLLVQVLDAMETGAAQAVPQPTEGVSLAPKLVVADARVDFTRPAVAVDRHVRGCTPAPGAWTTIGGRRLKLGPVEPVTTPGSADVDAGGVLVPGELRVLDGAVLVGTGTTPVRLGTVQPEGKAPMPATDWARGARPAPGTLLGRPDPATDEDPRA